MSPGATVHSWATVTDSVLLDGVEVGRHAVVRRAIIDKNVQIPENARIGLDPEEDTWPAAPPCHRVRSSPGRRQSDGRGRRRPRVRRVTPGRAGAGRVQVRPQHGTGRHPPGRRGAEELGVDVVFTWDHFYPLFGPPDGQHFECWTMLGAFAEITSRVELGALGDLQQLPQPELLADMSRTIDHISAAGLILGIGSGWFERDYHEYGYELRHGGLAARRLAASLPRIENRLASSTRRRPGRSRC